ncbi:hypothetical protein [Streptomyces sp. NPDC001315]
MAHESSAIADVPDMPAPQVWEFTAHGIGGGLSRPAERTCTRVAEP